MSLSTLQTQFLYTWCEFILWIRHQTYIAGFEVRVTETEGCMLQERMGRPAILGDPDTYSAAKRKFLDRVHDPDSLHYEGLARDLNVFIWEDKDNPQDGHWLLLTREHPVWRALGERWMSMHPLASWGGNWDNDANIGEPGEDDYNHFSFTHRGKK